MARLLKGRYEPLRLIAGGGQGRVLYALDHVHHRHVALKARRLGPDAHRERVLEEARILFSLVPHPGVTLVREDFFVAGEYYLVMDWIDGPTLAGVLSDQGRPGLALDRVCDVLGQVAAALDHMHAHDPPIVHGDVKPANVVLTSGGRAVLVDFGIAGRAGSREARAGTRGYAAPEVRAAGEATPASDIFGLAATAFALLTGAPPVPGATPPSGGDGVRNALEAGLAVDPARRPASARAFVSALRAPAGVTSGTVTFLLTDVEGSTRLWESDPASMAAALARHDALASEAVEAHGGSIVKSRGEGDSTFSVFRSAAEAIAAALALQRTLHAERWPTSLPLRVRAAVHTGEAEQRDGDFFGPTVNRCARLRAIAHGGQTLVSHAAATSAHGALPREASLGDLGPHRLKDLTEPEHVYQLRHPDLPAAFPALLSLDRDNLPAQHTSFVGRERERDEIASLVTAHRLVTLTGTGGVGKTRLSIEIGRELVAMFPDGVWFVDLAPVDDGRLVPAAAAAALGLREEADRPLGETLVAHLEPRALLVVLDNCEHLLEGCGALIEVLLNRCPKVRVLATSRQPLGIVGEVAHRVGSLELPGAAVSAEDAAATRLFCDRARLVAPGFAPEGEEAEAVARICMALDGIPLAIELAAARAGTLAAGEIARRLGDRFRLLGGGASSSRQRTLRATVAWSYDQLDARARLLLERLTVFRGFTLDAAEQVCAGNGVERGEVVHLLASLVDGSLVEAEPKGGVMRYRLLETIRLFASERLGATETARLRDRHLSAFLAVGERANAALVGADQARFIDVLDAEHDNMRAALAHGRGTEEGLRLAAALARFWSVRGHWTAGLLAIDEALAGSAGGMAARTDALAGAGQLAMSLGDYSGAAARHEEGLALATAAADDARAARSLNHLGEIARLTGAHDVARARYERALELARAVGDRRGTAQVLLNLGILTRTTGRREEAAAHLEGALALMQEVADAHGAAKVLNHLGLLAAEGGTPAGAATLFDQALAGFRRVGDRQGEAECLLNRGLASHASGEGAQEVRTLWERSLEIFRKLEFRRGSAQALYNLAILANSEGNATEAEGRGAAAVALWRRLGDARMTARTLLALGDAALSSAIPERAWARYAAAFRTASDAGAPDVAAVAITKLVDTKAGTEDAVRLCAAAVRAGVTPDAETVRELRDALGDDRFERAWGEGEAASLDDVLGSRQAPDFVPAKDIAPA
jgi:predicted ATPase/class 3 adenylate cyclase